LGVLLGPLMVQPDSFETLHARYDNARRLDEAGVKLAFRSGANHFSRGLRVDAGVTVAHGLRWETAITALTSGAGGLLGLGEGYGQLAVGAPATFFEATGDPLQARQSVRRVWIDGALTSRQTRQSKLAERYRVLR
jgi:imidazolonepropionase-like amidohydrolase